MNDRNERDLLGRNLRELRGRDRLTLEQVAERVGVTRQAVAKWESGESLPDVGNCAALADLYGVTLDDLVRFDSRETGLPLPPPPSGKHMFGTVRVGERGQIVIPKRAREIFGIRPGDTLVVLGDESPMTRGLALVDPEFFLSPAAELERLMGGSREEEP